MAYKGFLSVVLVIAVAFTGLYFLQNLGKNKMSFPAMTENYADVAPDQQLSTESHMPKGCGCQGPCDCRMAMPSPPAPCADDSAPPAPTCPGPVVDQCGSYQNVAQASCFPKSQLTPDDLLPSDECNVWSKNNPHGSGSLRDKNFLQAGWATGVSSVGSTLRNANLQLRSDPPNPQVMVSPWMQTTIQPDIGRKPFELGGQ